MGAQEVFLLRKKDFFHHLCSAMDRSELKAIKQNSTTICACFCAEYSMVECMGAGVCCAIAGKVCCCTGSLGCDCGSCCACEMAECYSAEQGCCEVSSKLFCCYAETQYPPGRDIGCGCCGAACCRTSDDAPPPE